MNASNGRSVLFDSHEDRIQNIEASQVELTAKIVEIATDQKHMVTAIETSTDRVVEELEKVRKDITSFDDRIGPLERQETVRLNRYKWWVALATTAIGALLGAIISRIVG